MFDVKNKIERIREVVYWHRWPLLFLFLAWLVFFSPIIFQGRVYFLDDLKIIYYPLEHEYAEAQSDWRLPQWSPYFGFGQPLMAWGQLGFFTPVHVLLRLFSLNSIILLQASIMIYFALGLIGMYAFLRRHVGNISAALGAIVFVFSGFHVAHIAHVNFYTATMLLPWLFFSIDYFIAKPRRQRVVYLVLVGAAMALSGQPQVVLYSYIVAAIYALVAFIVKLKQREDRKKFLARVGALSVVAIIVALLLSSFALLPLAEFLPNTERDDALAEAELAEFSYAPWHAITIVLPYFFGDYYNYSGVKGYQELAGYVGILPLMLVGIGLFWGWKRHSLYYSALTLIIISILLAPGEYSPLYTFLVTHKYFTSLAVPGRFIFFFVIGTAFLAAIGLGELMTGQRKKWQYMISALALPSFVLLPFIVKLAYDPALRINVVTHIISFDRDLIISCASVLALLVALVFAKTNTKLRFLAIAIVVLSAATLLLYGRYYTPFTTRAAALAEPVLARHLTDYTKDSGLPARLYARENIGILQTEKNELPKLDRSYETQGFLRHTQVTHNASSARWIGALSIRPYRQFIEKFFANDGEPIDGDGRDASDRERDTFNMSGITHLVSVVRPKAPDKLGAIGYTLVDSMINANYEVRLYENPKVFPKAYLLFDATFLAAADETRAGLLDRTHDSSKRVFISGPTPPSSLPSIPKTSYKEATITRYTPTRIEIATETVSDAVLILNDSTTPEWHTYIDGEPAPYYLANSIFKAALVPAGTHTVTFEYKSPAIELSKNLTLVGVIFLVFLIVPLRRWK